ncbi:hypothetical protein IW140_002376 [Coemansia sp. RSA 1813]|nr:hypothetical protein IW140_002376 [Coemansia sp. RSA 1813]
MGRLGPATTVIIKIPFESLSMDSLRDASAVGGLWRPTEREQRAYAYMLKLVDPQSEGAVRGQMAVPFLQKSGLSDAALGGIWQLSDTGSKGHLTTHEFNVAMKLISLAQSQRPVSLNNLKDDTPLPEMKGVDISQLEAASAASQPRRDSTTSSSGWPGSVSSLGMFDEGSASEIVVAPKDKLQYKQIFEKSQPVDGAISGTAARALFTKTKLNNEQLSKIWSLADPHSEGKLRLPGFIVAMYFIRRVMENRNFEIPKTCPVSLWRSAGGDVHLKSPLANLSQTSLASMPNLDTVSAHWDVTPDERKRYDQYFRSLDQNRTGYLSGDVPVNFFLKSRLPDYLLSSVWELADINHCGKLSKDEFAVAMHLINSKLAGKEIPDKLPPTLVPPSMRKSSISSSSMQNLSPQPYPGHLQDGLNRTNSYATSSRGSIPTGISRASTGRSPKQLSPVPDEAEISALQTQLGQLEDLSRGLQTQRTTTANQLALASSRKQELEVGISALKSSHEAETRINKELQDKLKAEEEQVGVLQAQVAEANKRLAVVSAQRDQLEQDVHRVQTRQLALQQNLRQAQEDGQQLNMEIGRLEQERRHLEQIISVAESQVKQQEDNNKSLNERASDLKSEVAELAERATAATTQTTMSATEQESLSFEDIFGTGEDHPDSADAVALGSQVVDSQAAADGPASDDEHIPYSAPQQQQQQQLHPSSEVLSGMPSFGQQNVASGVQSTTADAFASFGSHAADPFEEFLQSTVSGPRQISRSATAEPTFGGSRKLAEVAKATSDPRSVTSTPAPNANATLAHSMSFSQGGAKSTPASPFIDNATVSTDTVPRSSSNSVSAPKAGFTADFGTAFGVLPGGNARVINQDLESFNSKFPDISKLDLVTETSVVPETSAKETAPATANGSQEKHEAEDLTFESVFGADEGDNTDKQVENSKAENSAAGKTDKQSVISSENAATAAEAKDNTKNDNDSNTNGKTSGKKDNSKDEDDDFVPPPVVKRTNVSARPMSRVLSIFRSSSSNRSSTLSGNPPSMPRRTTAEKREQKLREQSKEFEEQWAKGDWPEWVKKGEHFYERKMLIEMGYNKDRVVEALEVNDFNLAQATDYLLSS